MYWRGSYWTNFYENVARNCKFINIGQKYRTFYIQT